MSKTNLTCNLFSACLITKHLLYCTWITWCSVSVWDLVCQLCLWKPRVRMHLHILVKQLCHSVCFFILNSWHPFYNHYHISCIWSLPIIIHALYFTENAWALHINVWNVDKVWTIQALCSNTHVQNVRVWSRLLRCFHKKVFVMGNNLHSCSTSKHILKSGILLIESI